MIRYFYIVLIFFTFSCANIVPPSGGPKDTTAALLIVSTPSKGERNFKDQKIELVFSEEIEASNLISELTITPIPNENPYKSQVRKNRLIIEFDKPLEENTTYTFNFGQAIKDLTEGNVSRDVSIAFSTGPIIDTLFIRGNVKDILSNTPADNYLVGLYSAKDTLYPKFAKPLYFIRTNTKGSYLIRNIKEGIYHVFAFNDKNKNLIWNEDEDIGFLPSIKSVENPQVNIVVATFDGKKPSIKNTKYYPDKTEIIFSEGIQNYKLSDGELPTTISTDGKILSVFKTKEITDTLKLPLKLIDSVGLDSTYIAKIFFEKPDKEEIKKGISISVTPLEQEPNNLNLNLQFNLPITESRINQVYFLDDTTKITLPEESYKWETSARLNIKAELKRKDRDSIQLLLPEKTFISIDTFNKEQKYKLEFLKEEEFGIIRGRIRTKQLNYIIELLNSKFEVVETLNNPSSFAFDYLPAGSYYLRAIADENYNQKWDQGNPFTFQQPESIIYYKSKIDVRANWEILDIEFSF